MKFDVFLEGKSIDLICITKNVVEKTEWYNWFNKKNLTKFTKQGYFPNTKANQKKYFLENIISKKRLQVGVVNKKNNTLIGMMSLYNINYFDRVCDISSIFNKDSKNMNSLIFFKEAQSLLINHAFYKLNLRRISAASNDEKLLKVNKLLFGFTHEGTIKERDYIDGKYVDRYSLGLLKSKWKKFLKK